jgi:SpoVK/Ycf46/Vps4 family AAA+-type ATPase
MLEGGGEVGNLFDRLDPTAPLACAGLIRVSGHGPYQVVRPTPAVGRALLGRATDLSPPPGAHLVTRCGDWDDLILPESTLAALRDLVAWIRQRREVVAKWGARPLGGPLALFSGPSGSGKSFGASIIASELTRRTGEPWALYALDLGRIMSKYVGETEQNLNALLDALDGRRAILQIDEADGLLGKRGEISDARDRYANLEVSHMLSRFERHDGPVILTTNLRTNIDAAFLRRFQQVVDFPAPDADARTRLWAALLPAGAPRAADVDAETLASAARLSGGAIHNAAFYASVLASEEAAPIAPRHLARAVWAELNKDNRQVRRSELGALAEYLEEEP